MGNHTDSRCLMGSRDMGNKVMDSSALTIHPNKEDTDNSSSSSSGRTVGTREISRGQTPASPSSRDHSKVQNLLRLRQSKLRQLRKHLRRQRSQLLRSQQRKLRSRHLPQRLRRRQWHLHHLRPQPLQLQWPQTVLLMMLR